MLTTPACISLSYHIIFNYLLSDLKSYIIMCCLQAIESIDFSDNSIKDCQEFVLSKIR